MELSTHLVVPGHIYWQMLRQVNLNWQINNYNLNEYIKNKNKQNKNKNNNNNKQNKTKNTLILERSKFLFYMKVLF